jgi:hypothetical protein
MYPSMPIQLDEFQLPPAPGGSDGTLTVGMFQYPMMLLKGTTGCGFRGEFSAAAMMV